MDKKTTTIVALVIGAILLYFPIKLGLWTYHTKKHLQQRKNLIFEETDHEGLLNACRNILRNPPTGSLLQESDYPLSVKNLKPSYVYIGSESLDIEMGGGFISFGVIAFKEGAEIHTENNESCGYKKLIEGLWYYEEK